MEFVTLEEINEAYLDCRHPKRRKRSSLEYELNYETNNLRLWRDLNERTYEVGKSIAFCVTRPKLREVFAADFRDRIVHHLLMMKFMPLLEDEMYGDSYNCRLGKGSLYGVNRVKSFIEEISENYARDAWILKFDIKGFFMSIDRDILWSMLESTIRSKYKGENIDWWLWLWEKVVYNRPELNCEKRGDAGLFEQLPNDKTLFRSKGKGLPIGNLSSQILANFYMSQFDLWVVERLGKNGRYGRYVDDGVIVHNNKKVLLKLLYDIKVYLREKLHITLHPNKVYIQEAKRGVKFVGVVIKPNRKYVINRTISNIMRVVEEYNQKRMATERFVARMNSYYGFLVHHNTYGIRWQIWNAIKDKSNLCCVNMRKLQIYNNNRLLVQEEANGQLVARWHNIKENEIYQDNNPC